jgi:hypothetical protein
MEACKNCGRPIGQLQTAHLWQGEVVCESCRRTLEEDDIVTLTDPLAPPPVAHAVPVESDNGSQAITRELYRHRKDSGQRMGCLIMVVGAAMCVVFWPLGLAVLGLGLLMMIVNTRVV